MCGRYVIFTSEEYQEMQAILKEIQAQFKSGMGTLKTGEIFPSYGVPAVLKQKDHIQYTILQWGLKSIPKKTIINARGETLEEKPLFSSHLSQRRCLLPANGFYEWNDKIKYLIQPESLPTFYFPGLYDKTGHTVIITTKASPTMEAIHPRMPVILDKEQGKIWLDRFDASLLRPYSFSLQIKKAG